MLYSYNAQDENDLSVERGQCVTVLNSDDPDWFWVSKFDGQEGFVPSGFIYPLDAIQRQRKIISQMTCQALYALLIIAVAEGLRGQPQPQRNNMMTYTAPPHHFPPLNGLPFAAPNPHFQQKPMQPWNGGSAGSSGRNAITQLFSRFTQPLLY